MDHKTLVNRFVKDSYRFEALHGEIDSLIDDVDSEVLAYEYEALANQAAEIILKLSANGENLGLNFYRYYAARLEYIIDYFRALLDYEETPLAEDKQDELDDEKARGYRRIGKFFVGPAGIRFEGDPADSAFPKSSDFFIRKWGFRFTPTAKDDENAAVDETDAAEEDDSKDEQPEELDDENDAQTAESDEAADDPAASAPISETDILLSLVEPMTASARRRLKELSPKVHDEVRETLAMWDEMNVITERYLVYGKRLPAAETLRRGKAYCRVFHDAIASGNAINILAKEREVRRIICETIDAIPYFRDSEKFKELIEQYPTYKEKEQ